jgi:broad specificity phosphatase PhoE
VEDGERFAGSCSTGSTPRRPAESGLRDLELRVASWYAELGAGDHLLVAHAGVVRALRVLIGGGEWASAMQRGVPHLVVETLVSRS